MPDKERELGELAQAIVGIESSENAKVRALPLGLLDLAEQIKTVEAERREAEDA